MKTTLGSHLIQICAQEDVRHLHIGKGVRLQSQWKSSRAWGDKHINIVVKLLRGREFHLSSVSLEEQLSVTLLSR